MLSLIMEAPHKTDFMTIEWKRNIVFCETWLPEQATNLRAKTSLAAATITPGSPPGAPALYNWNFVKILSKQVETSQLFHTKFQSEYNLTTFYMNLGTMNNIFSTIWKVLSDSFSIDNIYTIIIHNLCKMITVVKTYVWLPWYSNIFNMKRNFDKWLHTTKALSYIYNTANTIRWPSIESTLVQRLVFAEMIPTCACSVCRIQYTRHQQCYHDNSHDKMHVSPVGYVLYLTPR